MTLTKMMVCGMLAVSTWTPPALTFAATAQAGGVQQEIHAAGGVFYPLILVDDADLTPLTLVKECSHFTGKPGDYCSIVKSSFDAIPVGSRIFYYGPVIGPIILSTSIVLDAGDGSTAIGSCNVNNPANTGTCSFWAGSGKLQGFQALVALTLDADGTNFDWNGGYRIAGN